MTGFACPRCGAAVNAGARYCSGCGLDVSGEHGGIATARILPTPPPEPDDEALARLRHATLGQYDIYGELGRGGMATVYLAHDIALDRKVAIKVMAPSLVGGPGMVERFKREARTAASLSHPHIIPIYAVQESHRLLFFVMKYVEGRSLDAIIKGTGRLPIPMIQLILQQVGSAIGYAHRRGIIHRDIKPPNIMLDDEGWAVVTDFGIAKVTDAQGLTMTGATIGTPAYMSPEQCGAKEITPASDQYSLGVVTYEMLTGKAPFHADSLMALMWQHFHDPPRPIDQLRPDCPPELAAAVMRMLAKSPADRWPTMEDAAAAIGAPSVGPDDPLRAQMRALAREGASGRLSARVHTPESPLPRSEWGADAPTVPSSPRITKPHPTPPEARTTPAAPTGPAETPVTTPPARTPEPAVRTVPEVEPPARRGPAKRTRRAPWLVAAGVVVLGGAAAGAWYVWLGPGLAGSGAGADAPVTVPVHALIAGPSPASIAVGATIQLTGIPTDSAGAPLADRLVEWGTTDTAIASVSASGLVTGIRPGTATIAAVSEGRTGTATVIVTATTVPVASVELEPTTLALVPGDTGLLSVRPKDRDGNTLSGRAVAWESSDMGVAAALTGGRLVARGLGTATVTAVVEGHRGSARVTVAPPRVASVVVSPATASLDPGGRVSLDAQLRDAKGNVLSGRTVTWSSSDTSIAAVSPQGAVTAARAGTAMIRATSEGTVGAARVTVAPPRPAPVAALAVAPTTTTVPVGGTVRLVATARDAAGAPLTDRPVRWQSSEPATVSVSGDGTARGLAAGTARITATAEGQSASAMVTVEAPAPAPAPAVEQPPPQPPPVLGWRPAGLTAGTEHSCGLREDGSVACWGSNGGGQLGAAAGGQANRPLAVPGTLDATAIVAGATHTCALTRAGAVMCWGTNRRGQLGSGPVSSRAAAAPVIAGPERRYRALTAGAAHTCAIATDGAAFCWGDNGSGQLGNGSTRAAPAPAPVRGGHTFRAVAAGEKHTCGLTTGGKVYCWGDGFSGQLGRGIREQRLEPSAIDLDPPVIAIAAGRRHGCALAEDGALYCWGANDAGEIGDGSGRERPQPAKVASDVAFTAVTAGGAFTCALAGGDAYCWGRNREGQLGDGARADRAAPGRVRQPGPFEWLVAGEAHVCALTRTRQPHCWGANQSGQLGDGTLELRPAPVPVLEEGVRRP